ncbi:hypothetical protein SPBRAN_1301 [uncultured Candidatus Thioglobus sp.]|nr:hypothetical protein SPBRAN_1301 [uncultured Candidatus Thioglobus sp.]
MTISNPGLVLTSIFTYKSTIPTALSKAVTSPAMLSSYAIIALPVPTLDLTIYQLTTVFTSAVYGELSIPNLGLTVYEPTTVFTSAITIYEDLSIPTLDLLTIIEPTTVSTSVITIYEDLSIPTLGLLTTIEPTTVSTSAVTIYEPTTLSEDLSLPTLGLLTINEPTALSTASTSEVIIYKTTVLSAISTFTVYDPTALFITLDLASISIYHEQSIYEVTTYTPRFFPGGSCPNDKVPEVGWFQYVSEPGGCMYNNYLLLQCVSKIYISFGALWFFLFLAWCVCIKAIVRQHKSFCKERGTIIQ